MKPPRVHFSFRSPFSWMALSGLLRAVPDAFDWMELIPYWEPDAPTRAAMEARGATLHYVPMSKAKHLYILQDTKRQAAALGLPMVWPVDIEPWWEPSHLAWLQARRLGRARAFYDAVVAARWERGECISDPRVVNTLAASVGLSASLATDAVNDPEMRHEGVGCLVRAYEDDIFGVPYFRCGRERYWGADRLGLFLDELRRRALVLAPAPGPAPVNVTSTASEIPETVQALVGAYDTDAAGGCG
jgi:2-hydroxychromene-2-carboxylate isomerase